MSVGHGGPGRHGSNAHDLGVPAGGGRGDQGREQAHGLPDEGGTGSGDGGGSGGVWTVSCATGHVREVAVG
jgi:hypothetical protein